MSGTPRTDAAVNETKAMPEYESWAESVDARFARQLETELAEKERELAELRQRDTCGREELAGLRKELEEAREQAANLRECLDAAQSRICGMMDELHAAREAIRGAVEFATVRKLWDPFPVEELIAQLRSCLTGAGEKGGTKKEEV